MIVILLMPFLLGSAWSQYASCPTDDVIEPCYCLEEYIVPSTVVCDKFSFSQVEKVLAKIKGRGLALEFQNTNFGNIPSTFFDNQVIPEIAFVDCQIESFDSKSFSGLENSLERLYIISSVSRSQQSFKMSLGHLKQLQEVSFSFNNVSEVGNDWFREGPRGLEVLTLKSNMITTLGDETFSSLTNLQQLWLSDNIIKELKRSMLPGSSQLTVMDFSHNIIEVLPEDFFSDMPKLKVVNFESNHLTTLSEKPWSDAWSQLEEIYVDHNYEFQCDQKMRWIYQRNSLPSVFEGKCYGRNNLHNMKFEDLTNDHFDTI